MFTATYEFVTETSRIFHVSFDADSTVGDIAAKADELAKEIEANLRVHADGPVELRSITVKES